MPIDEYMVKRIFVDNGSSGNILLKDTFLQMDISWTHVTPYVAPLVGFIGKKIQSKGKFSFLVNVWSTSYIVKFLIVSVSSPYNCIMGRPTLYQLPAKIAACDLSMEVSDGNNVHVTYSDKKRLKNVILLW